MATTVAQGPIGPGGTPSKRLRALIASAVGSAGSDLEDLAVTKAGRRRVVRVTVDRDGGVTLDEVAELSRAISEALDADDVMGETPYVLEVSSPGVDRPLAEPRHFRRARGRLVAFALADGTETIGRVLRADEAAVTVRADGGSVEIPYATILRARVQVEFGHASAEDEDEEREEA